VSQNPVQLVDAPRAKAPDPQPPTPEEAARIVEEACQDPDWGMLVWITMVTGARRGELCGLRWSHVNLPGAVLTIRRAIAQHGTERGGASAAHESATQLSARAISYVTELDHVAAGSFGTAFGGSHVPPPKRRVSGDGSPSVSHTSADDTPESRAVARDLRNLQRSPRHPVALLHGVQRRHDPWRQDQLGHSPEYAIRHRPFGTR
jgi:integrase